MNKNNILQDNQVIHNPYKIVSGLQENCILKAAFSYLAGGAMGLALAMFTNAIEMRQIEIGKIRRSTAIILRKDWRRMSGTAKGFAVFGGFFVLFECMIQHVRTKDDGLNSFLAGGATSIVLAGNLMSKKDLLYSGLGGGTMCFVFYKVFKMLGY